MPNPHWHEMWNSAQRDVAAVIEHYNGLPVPPDGPYTNITTRDLLPRSKPIAAALSGGKDSLFQMLCLEAEGYEVVPIIIDMGYVDGWGEVLADRFGKHGYEPQVIDVHALDGPTETVVELGKRLERLDSIVDVKESTPCTHCYSSKVLALDAHMTKLGLDVVAFGHHRTDSLASLIKAALMDMDRFGDEKAGRQPHPRFDRATFIDLTHRLRKEILKAPIIEGSRPHQELTGPVLRQLVELAASGLIDTDEPVRQPLIHGKSNGVELVRPLHNVDEPVIAKLIGKISLPVEGSGCGHGATADEETPREIVHNRLLKALPHNRLYTARLQNLLFAMRLGLRKTDGSSIASTRYNRTARLGSNYRPSDMEKL